MSNLNHSFTMNGGCEICFDMHLTLKIPGPHFPTNYRVNANWHEGFNGIFVHYSPSLRVPVDVYGMGGTGLTCHQSD